jgi:PKD repeat protein
MKLVTSLALLVALLAAAPAVADDGCSSEQSPGSRCDVSRPQVSLAATPASPHAGAQVKLTATGSGRGITYAWDLDEDGEFDDATGAEVTHSFAVGAPRVGVRVTDWEGRTAAEARTLEVHAGDRPPSGSLMLGPPAPRVGGDVTAYADGQDSDGRIARVEFDLDGDGTYEVTGAGQTTQTRFDSAGRRTLRARFVDDGGNVSVVTTEVDVHAGDSAPFVRLNMPGSQPKVGEKVNIWAEATDADDQDLTYAYDLDGDGSFETAGDFMLETSYATAGTRDIGVRVTDAGGAIATARASLSIRDGNEPPAVSLKRIGLTRSLFASGADADDGMPGDFSWDLDGDGAFDDASGFILNYLDIPGTAPGTYDVGVRVTDRQGGAAIARRAVTIHNLPATVPSITVTPAQPRVGDTVSFDAGTLSDDLTNVSWNGATTPDFDHPLHATATFDTPGAKSVTANVTPRGGAVARNHVTVNVSPAAGNLVPAAQYTASTDWPRTGTAVTFTDASTDADGTIAARAWDLDDDGDYDDGTGAEVTRTYPTSGTRSVGLQVTDDDGAQSIQRRMVDVHDANLLPRAVIGSAAGDGTLVLRTGETSTLTGGVASGADDAVASYAWDTDGDGFDDGAGSTLQVSWSSAGIRTVRLRATDESGASDVATVLVDVRPADANHAPILSANGPGGYSRAGVPVTLSAFTADAEGDPVLIAWDLDADGDYDDATGPSVQHTYPAAGDYPVRVRASDGRGGVRTVLFTVGVIAEAGRSPVIQSIQVPPSVRPGRQVAIRVFAWDPDMSLNPYPGNLQGVTLAFDLDGDGEFDDTPAVADDMGGYTWTFAATPVTVRVRAKDATDRTAIASVQVTPDDGNLAPVPSLFVPAAVADKEATFFAQASDADSAGAATFAWDADDDGDFDDGTGATLKRTFATPGTYTVRVRATDGDGASAVVARTFGVGAGAPDAAFDAPSTALVNTPVSLTSTTSGAWDLDGDGDFDDAAGPTASVTFSKPGAQLVGLKVRNADGDLGIRYASIDVTSPVAATPTPTPQPRSDGPIWRIAKNPLELTVVAGRTPKLAAVLKSGLSVTVRCSACRTTVVASVDKKTAKKLHLRSRNIGRGTGFGGAVKVKLSSDAKRALKRVKSVQVTLTMSAIGSDGLGATASRTLVLKR